MAGFLTVEDMLQDPVFVAKVEDEWEETKARIKSDARSAKFKPGIEDRFVEALRIFIEYEKAKKAGQWDNGFYMLHLYLECALGASLNKNTRFPKQAEEVQETLDMAMKELELCMGGIRKQIIEKHRREAEEAILSGKVEKAPVYPRPSAPPPSASQTQSEGKKRYSSEQARDALDALRIDGKRKSSSKLYDLDIGKPSNSKPVHPPSGPPPPAYLPPPSQPPPSYNSVSAGGITGFLHTQPQSNSNFVHSSTVRIKKVTGDGSCAFRSIAQGRADGRLDLQSETRAAAEIRRTVVSELNRCADEEMTGTGLTVEQLVLMKDTKFPTFSEYTAAMARSEYAGETEFWLLARRMGINIAIYQPKGPGYEHMITYGDSNVDPVMLLWQRGRTESGNHYDVLLQN